jgi:hypothetical protein
MKIWRGYGSEHSMNLVMIGQFKDATDATQAKEVIDRLTEQVNADVEDGKIEIGEHKADYTDKMLDRLINENIMSIGPSELQQLAYEVDVGVEDDRLVMTTEEVDVSVFLKVMLDKGARVEVYSAHHYPGTGHGRGG